MNKFLCFYIFIILLTISNNTLGMNLKNKQRLPVLQDFLENFFYLFAELSIKDLDTYEELEKAEYNWYKAKNTHTKNNKVLKIITFLPLYTSRKKYSNIAKKKRLTEWDYCCMDITPASHKIERKDYYMSTLLEDIKDPEDQKYIKKLIKESKSNGLLEKAIISIIYRSFLHEPDISEDYGSFLLNQFPKIRQSIFRITFKNSEFQKFIDKLMHEDYSCYVDDEDGYDKEPLSGTKRVLEKIKANYVTKKIKQKKQEIE